MKTGFELLDDAFLNKGTAFTESERKKTWIGRIASALCRRYRNAGTAYLPPNGKENFLD